MMIGMLIITVMITGIRLFAIRYSLNQSPDCGWHGGADVV